MLRRWFEAIRREDDGQDLIEYTLLIGFLALASAGVLMQVGNSGRGAWSGAQTTISGAAAAVSPSTATSNTGGRHDHDGRD